jgi:hypothetical protein
VKNEKEKHELKSSEQSEQFVARNFFFRLILSSSAQSADLRPGHALNRVALLTGDPASGRLSQATENKRRRAPLHLFAFGGGPPLT